MASQASITLRLAANIDALERQLDKAKAKVANSAGAMAKEMGTANKKVTDGLAANASAMSRFGKLTRNQQFIVRDMSYQLSDMAVQLGNGTSFLRSFGQQVPQMLGPMGMFGAVLGTVVAIAAPLAQALMGGSKSAETLAQRVDDLSKAVDAYGSYVNLVIAPTKQLEARFGAATVQAIQFIDALSRVAKAKAVDDASLTTKHVASAFPDINGVSSGQVSNVDQKLQASVARLREIMKMTQDQVQSAGARKILDEQTKLGATIKFLSELSTAVSNLSESLKLPREQIKAILAAVADIGNAKGVDQQRAAFLEFKRAMDAAYPNIAAMPKDMRDLYEQVAKSGQSLAHLKGLSDSAESGISAAAGAASKLADELGRAMGNAVSLANSAAFDKKLSQLRYQYRGDPVAYAGAAEGMKFDQQQQALYGASADLPPEVIRLFAQRRAQAVADAEAKARTDLQYSKWQQSQSAGAKAGGAAIKGTAALFASADNALAQQRLQIELIGKTGAEAAKLREQYALLAEAKRRNLDLDKVDANTGRTLRQEIAAKAAAIGELTQKAQDYTAASQFMTQQQQALKQGFLDAIVSGKSFGSVLGQVAQQLEKAALQAAIFGDGPLASLFGGVSSGGSGLVGSLMSAIGFRASGGPVTAGQPYIVGEKQAELFVPNQNGSILPSIPKVAASGGSMSGKIGLHVFFDQNGNLDGRIAHISGSVSAQHIQLLKDKVLPQMITSTVQNGPVQY